MQLELQFKIYKDKKQAEFLKRNSFWYRELNRDPLNYKQFYSEFKKQERNQKMNKMNSAIDTLDTVNSIFKVIN